ncbi:YlxM family DNA-binding protein [Paenibacillus sp. CCS19]|uniref:YlxM family DNA-binding protein n=1 Tax=Paenibacillus sp. CCS19 TaxID=3158387 RepID=UPI00295EE2C3|nr:YlxM family DNA-binding protein [Paenibacillus cellulosilyticus]
MTSAHTDALEKTNRMNMLFDFYEPLLTDKQRTFLMQYFIEDFTLGEIAAEVGISRQAVYEHIKRAETVLENYEAKLGLLGRHQALRGAMDELEAHIATMPQDGTHTDALKRIADSLRHAEQTRNK